MINIQNVSKFILNDISIYIPKGKTVGLIGASGAGKTTFLKLVCGLLEPECGSVFTMGVKPYLRQKSFRVGIAMFFAGVPMLEEEETVESNFEALKNIYGMDKALFACEYRALTKRLGFADVTSRPVRELSLGQKRRVEIAAVLIHHPELLLMDEPTIGLDENAKQAFYELLEERKQEGLTTVLTSHNMEEISHVCDRIMLLKKGKLLYYGTEWRLKKAYAPVNSISLEIDGRFPDLEDLPLKKYVIEGNKLQLVYDSNHVTAAEILKHIFSQSGVRDVTIHTPDLTDVIMQISRGEKDE